MSALQHCQESIQANEHSHRLMLDIGRCKTKRTLDLTYVLLVCYRPSISRLDRLEEDSTPAQALDVDPVAVVHTKMAGVVVIEDAVVDLVCYVPHSNIHRRIDKTADHI